MSFTWVKDAVWAGNASWWKHKIGRVWLLKEPSRNVADIPRMGRPSLAESGQHDASGALTTELHSCRDAKEDWAIRVRGVQRQAAGSKRRESSAEAQQFG